MAYINGKEILFSSTFSTVDNDFTDTLSDVIEGEIIEMIVPDGVEIIREYAFYRQQKMTKITFPSLTRIGRAAFSTCTKCLVYDFTRNTVVPALDDVNAFTSINASAKIRVPSVLYSEWIAATNWSNYKSYIEAVIDGIVSPTNDETMTVTVNTAQDVQMGFYFSDNLTAGTRYVSHTWIDNDTERTNVYELSEAQTVLTMGEWFSDSFSQGEYNCIGDYYIGAMTFKQSGTYRIYQKYYDAAGDEYETGSYIFEVT